MSGPDLVVKCDYAYCIRTLPPCRPYERREHTEGCGWLTVALNDYCPEHAAKMEAWRAATPGESREVAP